MEATAEATDSGSIDIPLSTASGPQPAGSPEPVPHSSPAAPLAALPHPSCPSELPQPPAAQQAKTNPEGQRSRSSDPLEISEPKVAVVAILQRTASAPQLAQPAAAAGHMEGKPEFASAEEEPSEDEASILAEQPPEARDRGKPGHIAAPTTSESVLHVLPCLFTTTSAIQLQ